MSPMYDLPNALRCDIEHFREFRIGLARHMAFADLLVALVTCYATRHGRIQIPKDDILGLLYLGKDRTRLRL